MNRIRLKPFAAAILLPLAAGGLAAYLTRDAMQSFDRLYKPLLSSPGWMFPAVWTVLYILMGIASYLVFVSDASFPRKKRALTLYAVSLGVNVLWPFIFFSMGAYFLAFLWILLLAVLVCAVTIMFGYINRCAEKLLIPYLVWLAYAAYLNLGIFLLN